MSCFRKIKRIYLPIIYLLWLFVLLSCSRQSDVANRGEQAILDSLLKSGEDSLKTNPRSAINLLKQAKTHAKDSLTYYKADEMCGTAYFWLGKLDSAMLLKKQTFFYLNKQPLSEQTKELLSSTYNSSGNIYAQIGKIDSALILYKKAIQYNPKKEREPDILINMADQYKNIGNYAQATFYLRRALFLTDSLKLGNMKFPINFALGDIYLNLRDFKEADKYYKLAENEYSKRELNEKIVFCNNRGNYYYYQQNYKKADNWFKREKQLTENSGNQFSANLSYLNLADVSLNLGGLDSALYYADKAEKYFQTLQFKAALYYINAIRIGVAIKQKDDVKASQLKGIFNDFEQDVDPNLITIRNRYIEQMYATKGNYKKAYEYLNKNIMLNDSLRKGITQKRIEELDMRYKQDTLVMAKEAFIQHQKSEVKSLRLNIYLWIMVSVSGLLLSILAYFVIQRRNNRQRLQYLEQVTKFKMTNIRNRISPHFLFNVLNNEISGINEEKKERLFTLVHLLRKSLDLADQISIPLRDEVEFAKAYIELEKHRLGDNFAVAWNIDEDVDLESLKIIPMMLQIPIENAIKHGLALLERDKKLEIKLQKENKGIRVYITDNGIGFHPKTELNISGTGTGLRVINQTIQILNSHNKEKITFLIQKIDKKEDTGTIVEIFIPQNFKFEYR
jgi:tetratricopeptide (TPR) repeat protein